MHDINDSAASQYRVWITRSAPGQAARQAAATAIEPAEQGTMPRRLARAYVESFNRAARAEGRVVRAVAMPVRVRYEGEPTPGEGVKMG